MTTHLVQLNVIAVDKNGKPVTDLTQHDFSLRDEGKEQEIAAFSLEGSAPKVSAALTPPPGAKVFSNRPKVQVNGLTVMLLDELNTNTEDQIRAKQQMVASLSELPPDERVSLYLLGGNLQLLHDFTTETAELLKVLQRHGARINREVAEGNPERANTGDRLLDQFLNTTNRKIADYANVNRAEMTLAALTSIAQQLAPIPGRKNLVWISGGFPFSIGFDGPMRAGSTRERRTFSDEAEKAAKVLNDAQLAVYPVDARGLQPSVISASSGARPNPRRPGANGTPGPDHEYETMDVLAERTGGRAFHNTNDLTKAVLLAVNDAHITYSLAFYPKNQVWDGRFHKLKVKVDRPGVQLRYRAGYFAFERQSETPAVPPIPKTLNEAIVAPVMTTGLGLNLGLAAESGGFLGTVEVDPRDLQLKQQDGKWTGTLEVQIVIGHASDRRPGAKTTVLNLNLTEPAYQEALLHGFLLKTHIQMLPGNDEVRIGVRDANSGAIGTLYLSAH